MIANLSRRERLVIGLAVILAAVLGGWLYVVEPIREHNRSTAELVPAREQVLQQRRDLIGRQAQITAELEATMKRFDRLSEGFLTAGTPAVAASELQKIVKDMAAQARTEVRSERILPPADRGELLEIPVEIAVSCEIRQLVDLLARLDNAPKILPVQELKIRVVNLTQPKDLLVTLTVSGFLLQAAPGKAKS